MRAEGQNPKSAIRLSAIWPQSAISSLGLLLAFALLCVTLSLISPYFLTLRNLTNVLAQGSINTVLAIGLTFVIIGGGIDLSVGSALALVGSPCVHFPVTVSSAASFGLRRDRGRNPHSHRSNPVNDGV